MGGQQFSVRSSVAGEALREREQSERAAKSTATTLSLLLRGDETSIRASESRDRISGVRRPRSVFVRTPPRYSDRARTCLSAICPRLLRATSLRCDPVSTMSTAVMSQSALYEFGDIILKNSGMNSPEAAPGAGAHLGVGPTAAVRYTLTRMASTPASNNATATANLVNSLLGNLTQHHHHHHRRLERTQSAPAPASPAAALAASAAAAAAAAAASAQVNTSRYKTELCRPYEEFGVCKYGDKCQFAHGMAELRNLARHPKYKTELCRTYHTVGFCPYGPRCHFVHNQDEVIQQQALAANTGSGTGGRNSGPLAISAPCRTQPPTALQQQPQRNRPAALSPALSLDSAASSASNMSTPCSLSQSPTSSMGSMGSFFSSEPELHSPGVLDDQRLPVFNRLSAPVLALGDLL